MPLFKEEDIVPVNTNIDLSENSFAIQKVLPQDEKKYMPDPIEVEEMIMSVDFHPEQKLLAMGCVDGQTFIYKYSLDDNERVAVFQQHVDSCREVCFSDNGKYLLSASADRSINSVNIAREKMQFEITNAHKYPIHTFIVCDDNMLASGDDEGYVRVWDVRQGGKPIKEFAEHAEYVSDFDYESEDKTLYSTSADGTLAVMDLRKMKLVEITKQYQKDLLSVCESNRGSKIGCGTSKGDIIVFENGRWEEPSFRLKTTMSSVDTLCFITEKIVAAGSADGNIHLFSFDPKKSLGPLCKSEDPVYKLALDPTGNYLASCGASNIVRFWNSAILYGKNLVDRIEQQEENEESVTTTTTEIETPTTTTTDGDNDTQQQQGKKRKKNTEKIDTRKKKKAYNNKSKAFFHDLVNEY